MRAGHPASSSSPWNAVPCPSTLPRFVLHVHSAEQQQLRADPTCSLTAAPQDPRVPVLRSCRARQPPRVQHCQTIILGLRRWGSAAGILINSFSQRALGICSEVFQFFLQLAPWGAVGGPGGAGMVQGSCFLQERHGRCPEHCPGTLLAHCQPSGFAESPNPARPGTATKTDLSYTHFPS